MIIVGSGPALADQVCVYIGDRTGMTAVEAGNVFTITDGSTVVDTCVERPGELTRFAKCKGGWSGKLFFAGSHPNDLVKGDIMVLLDEVWFRECK